VTTPHFRAAHLSFPETNKKQSSRKGDNDTFERRASFRAELNISSRFWRRRLHASSVRRFQNHLESLPRSPFAVVAQQQVTAGEALSFISGLLPMTLL
jgi:hypothetical protein